MDLCSANRKAAARALLPDVQRGRLVAEERNRCLRVFSGFNQSGLFADGVMMTGSAAPNRNSALCWTAGDARRHRGQ